MVNKIATALSLPPFHSIVKIEDIATEHEIKLAREQRMTQGKHIIPVPTLEIRKDFSGYFIDPLKIFRLYGKDKQVEALEMTVVRPTFIYIGKLFISDLAIESLIINASKYIDEIYRIFNIAIVSRPEGVLLYFDVIVKYVPHIHKMLEEFQEY